MTEQQYKEFCDRVAARVKAYDQEIADLLFEPHKHSENNPTRFKSIYYKIAPIWERFLSYRDRWRDRLAAIKNDACEEKLDEKFAKRELIGCLELLKMLETLKLTVLDVHYAKEVNNTTESKPKEKPSEADKAWYERTRNKLLKEYDEATTALAASADDSSADCTCPVEEETISVCFLEDQLTTNISYAKDILRVMDEDEEIRDKIGDSNCFYQFATRVRVSALSCIRRNIIAQLYLHEIKYRGYNPDSK